MISLTLRLPSAVEDCSISNPCIPKVLIIPPYLVFFTFLTFLRNEFYGNLDQPGCVAQGKTLDYIHLFLPLAKIHWELNPLFSQNAATLFFTQAEGLPQWADAVEAVILWFYASDPLFVNLKED